MSQLNVGTEDTVSLSLSWNSYRQIILDVEDSICFGLVFFSHEYNCSHRIGLSIPLSKAIILPLVA